MIMVSHNWHHLRALQYSVFWKSHTFVTQFLSKICEVVLIVSQNLSRVFGAILNLFEIGVGDRGHTQVILYTRVLLRVLAQNWSRILEVILNVSQSLSGVFDVILPPSGFRAVVPTGEVSIRRMTHCVDVNGHW